MIRFAIKNTASKAEKEGDVFIRYTGTAEPFSRVSERACKKVAEDQTGNPVLTFTTGLDENQTQFYGWYSELERAEVKKRIAELKPIISDYYGGDSVISDRNKFFWLENRDVSRLSLTHEQTDIFFDTKNPIHALLYLSIIGGAFIDLVAPTKEWAERNQIQHYLILETEDTFEDEDEITRSDAHGALSELRKDASTDALFILAWCIQYDTNAYGAYRKSASNKDLINYHIKYIDGKLVSKKKRNTAKVFIEYYNKWIGQQTRPALYAEAYVKAGEYFNFLNKKDKKYTTTEGTALGNTVDEAVANLMKPKFSEELQKLRDLVEAKWKE